MQQILERQTVKQGNGRFSEEVKHKDENPQKSSHVLIANMG